jgi:tetratricopeptide (TPR) repeat protein
MIAMKLDPENDTIKINLAVFYLRQKEYEKSEAIWKYLILKRPNDGQLHFRLGGLYKEMGRYEAALSELKKSSELAPNIINPYEEMGNIYASRLKDREKAIYYYSKGIEAAPKAKSRVEDLRWMVQDLER